MPQQLIFTSAPSGLKPGKSGYCTVAVSGGIREALVLRLEQASYYSHPAGGGTGRPVFASRVMDLRGTRYHVLSRIQDAGLDFTGRTNYLAHHLIFTPEELPDLPSPPVIFRDWNGWRSAWTESPRHLADESWGNLPELSARDQVPAATWREVTRRAANASGLLDLPAPAYLQVGGLTEPQLLGLIAESLQMLEVRSADGLHRVQAWLHTFTTGLQEQDDVRDFRWRCVTPESPAFARLQGSAQRLVALSQIQSTGASDLESLYAEKGPCAPEVHRQPRHQTATEGMTIQLTVEVRAVPPVTVQEWYECDRQGNPVSAPVAAGPVLELPNIALGEKRFRFRAANVRGQEVWSEVANVSAEPKVRLVTSRRPADPGSTPLTLQSSSKGNLPAGRTPSSQRGARENDLASRNERSVLGWAVFLVLLLGLCAVGVWRWKRSSDPFGLKVTNDGSDVVLQWNPIKAPKEWNIRYEVRRWKQSTNSNPKVVAGSGDSLSTNTYKDALLDAGEYFYEIVANKIYTNHFDTAQDKRRFRVSKIVSILAPSSSTDNPNQAVPAVGVTPPASPLLTNIHTGPKETSDPEKSPDKPKTAPVPAEATTKPPVPPKPAAVTVSSPIVKTQPSFEGNYTNGWLKIPTNDIAKWIQAHQPPYSFSNLSLRLCYGDKYLASYPYPDRNTILSPHLDQLHNAHELWRAASEREPALEAWDKAWEELRPGRPGSPLGKTQFDFDKVFKTLNEPKEPQRICDAFWNTFGTLCAWTINDGDEYSFRKPKDERTKEIERVRKKIQNDPKYQVAQTAFGGVVSDKHFATLNDLFDDKNLHAMLRGKSRNLGRLRKEVGDQATAQSRPVEPARIVLKLEHHDPVDHKTSILAEVTFK